MENKKTLEFLLYVVAILAVFVSIACVEDECSARNEETEEEKIIRWVEELQEVTRLPDYGQEARREIEQREAEFIRLKELLTEMKRAEYITLQKLNEIPRLTAKLQEKQTQQQERLTDPPSLKVFVDDSSSPTATSEQFGAKLLEALEKYNLKYASQTDNEQKCPTHPPSLSEMMSSIPGFKFEPNDEEIFSHLKKKSSNPCQTPFWTPIKDCADLYSTDPWHLPGANSIKELKELYFYVLTKKKSESGDRIGPNGFWRAGKSKKLFETVSEIGYRRQLKYFEYVDDKNHKSFKHRKPTNWLMHEYRLASTSSQSKEESSEHLTICKIRNNDPNIHIQHDGDMKVSKIVDSEQDETAQDETAPAIYQSVAEFERWNQEQRGKSREQFEYPSTSGFDPSTSDFIGRGFDPSTTSDFIEREQNQSGFDPSTSDFIWREQNQSQLDPSTSEQQTSLSWGDSFLNLDFIERADEYQFLQQLLEDDNLDAQQNFFGQS